MSRSASFYLFPIMLAAGFSTLGNIGLGILCAFLSERFSNLDPADAPIRTSFEALALSAPDCLSPKSCETGFAISIPGTIARSRRNQSSRTVTVDDRGLHRTCQPGCGRPHGPTRWALDRTTHRGISTGACITRCVGKKDRSSGRQWQCLGHRGNGESFLADVWFSSYKEGTTPKAAIIADVTEERTATAESTSDAPNPKAGAL